MSNYYISVRSVGNGDITWEWQILRRTKPMGIKLYGGGYKSQTAARRAGSKALNELLIGLGQNTVNGTEASKAP